jgi:hypothetical protein
MINALENIWKQAVIVYFGVIIPQFSLRNLDNRKHFSITGLCTEICSGPSDYKEQVLPS